MAGRSPTESSLKYLRDQGWMCDVVEKYIHAMKIRKDLWGFGDILCLRDGETLLVQTTSYSNMNARVNKIMDSEHEYALNECRKAGWLIHVHGWRKIPLTKGSKSLRWALTVKDLS
jgi:hypothetical protein